MRKTLTAVEKISDGSPTTVKASGGRSDYERVAAPLAFNGSEDPFFAIRSAVMLTDGSYLPAALVDESVKSS